MSVTAAQRLLLFEKQTVSVSVRIFLTFHKGMGNIIAKSLENDIGLLHIGYLTIAQIPLSSLGQLYLEYLSKDIDTLEILGTSMEDH